MQSRPTTRVALVTGGTRGIGAATSLALKEAGYSVVAAYGGNDEAATAFSRTAGIPVFRWNVADGQACREGVAAVSAQLGSIDVLVNNAGITRDRAFRSMSDEDWRDVIVVAENPVGRLGTAEEIARCVVFLASDAAGFTGSTLPVNGGAYLT